MFGMIRTAPSSSAEKKPPIVPGWAIPNGSFTTDVGAAFMASAALNTLDALVRSDPAWAGAWRQRLALKCAASAVRLAGRGEDEAGLRDVWNLHPSGADPSTLGPAGSILAAWRRLASKGPSLDADMLAGMVEMLGLRWSDAFASIPDQVVELARDEGKKAAPQAAAAIAAHVHAVRPDAELLAWWLADLVLARNLGWPRPVPLLTARAFTPAFRAEGLRGARIRPGEQDFERAVFLAIAHGAAEACRLGAEIARRADRLAVVMPRLRAKGAGEAIQRLLEEDAVPARLRRETYRGLRLGGCLNGCGRSMPCANCRDDRHSGCTGSRMTDHTGRRAGNTQPTLLDTELEDLPAELRWCEWMGRVEAVIFAASEPVARDMLARVVGKSCNIDLIIDDIRDDLRGRPYELCAVAGGWQFRTKKAFGDVIRAVTGLGDTVQQLSKSEGLVLMCIAYYQPITRAELSSFFGKEVSRDLIGTLRSQDLIASGPRSPTQGAPYTYVTTRTFIVPFRARYVARPARLRGALRCRPA